MSRRKDTGVGDASVRPESKFCSGCGQWKDLEEFARNANRVDGLQTWCERCLKALEDPKTSNRWRAVRRYKRARAKAYQVWFREQRHETMIDKRWISQPDMPVIRLRWSRRLKRVTAFDGTEATTTMRVILQGPFRCDPESVALNGRGGGSGGRWQPKCLVEGQGVDEKAWEEGLQELAEGGWAVLREGHEDVVAVGH